MKWTRVFHRCADHAVPSDCVHSSAFISGFRAKMTNARRTSVKNKSDGGNASVYSCGTEKAQVRGISNARYAPRMPLRWLFASGSRDPKENLPRRAPSALRAAEKIRVSCCMVYSCGRRRDGTGLRAARRDSRWVRKKSSFRLAERFPGASPATPCEIRGPCRLSKEARFLHFYPPYINFFSYPSFVLVSSDSNLQHGILRFSNLFLFSPLFSWSFEFLSLAISWGVIF